MLVRYSTVTYGRSLFNLACPIPRTCNKSSTLLSLRNPGCFDGELYNRINNIGGRLTKAQLVPSAEQGQAAPASSLWRQLELQLAEWNLALRHALQNSMGKQAGALLGSMLLGGSSSLDEEMREIFTANGLAHLLSVSGTHLVLLAGLLA